MITDDEDSDSKGEQEGVESTIAKQIFDEDDEGLDLIEIIFFISMILKL